MEPSQLPEITIPDRSESTFVDISALEKAWDRDWREHLDFLDDWLVRQPDSDAPFYTPYLPWLGPDYQQGGIFLMATAQNLGQFQVDKEVDHRKRWEKATGWPDKTLRRLEPRSFEDWRLIPIQPWMDGIMAALAGLWMFAQTGDAPRSLDGIARQVAVTNYFKHSLRKITQSGQRDHNPVLLVPTLRDRYVRFTCDYLVKPEITALKPSVVIGFTTLGKMGGFVGVDTNVVLVNDPSWIKQGMSGVAREKGSWRLEVEKSNIPEALDERVEGWLGQLGSPYSTGKRESTRIYLLYTWLKFREKL
jgi:hypothetical protein